MQPLIRSFQTFVDASPTSFHAAKEIADALLKKGFIQIDEKEPFKLALKKSYFIQRNGSIIAFKLPTQKVDQLTILGSHTDSPALKLKPKPLFCDETLLLGTEVYGSPHLPSWMAADLCIAGQVALRHSKGVETKLIHLKETPCTIANAPIHLDPSPNSDSGLKINKEMHLRAIASLLPSKGGYLESLLKCTAILSHDLFLVPCDPLRFLGPKQEIISSYRIDNLSSVFASLHAILHAKARTDTMQMALFWDHEEIGSSTEEGAASPLFIDTLKRICLALDVDQDAFFRIKNRSFCLSLDAAHAFHPNYASLFDKEHAPQLGRGIALKLNANRRYASSSHSATTIIELMQKEKIDYQLYVSHSNQRCGSTIGPIFATQTGIETVDMGAPILGMHSIKEQMATQDLLTLCKLTLSTLDKI
ncbi:MAG: M18 family aminopeptidase [Simkaniaceae bacterium]|nr:M18 family aminopeptidase [Simkaniaceae bacterium]